LARLPPLDPAALTAAQKAVYDEIAAYHTGNVRGPWAIALRIPDPEVARNTHQLYERLSPNAKIGRRLIELMILVVARHWNSQFEWYAHEKQALEHGIAADAVEAIRERRLPHFGREDERVVYEAVTELSESKTLSAAAYERARACFGEELLVELIAAAGLYTMIAMMLNAFDAPIPEGARRLT
jgi:4-carboxymuconolactone decarboxylase